LGTRLPHFSNDATQEAGKRAVTQEFALKISRREFCQGTASLALTLGVVAAGLSPLTSRDAFAQKASDAALMDSGGLEDMMMGDPKAPVTVIEYASTTCPHCAHFYETTFPELKKRYIDTGKIRYIYREFVLNQLDAAAVMLLRCTEKDKYFPLLDAFFLKQKEWVVQQPIPPLLALAKQAGFTEESFNACLDTQKNAKSKELLDKIEARNQAAQKLGVNSTPTFFVNGKKMKPGDVSIDDMAKEIDPLLKS
jgi:protein-disulfide isomerase